MRIFLWLRAFLALVVLFILLDNTLNYALSCKTSFLTLLHTVVGIAGFKG